MTTSLLDPAAVRACVFALAGQPFAIDVTQVREVAIFEEWTTVPLAPPHRRVSPIYAATSCRSRTPGPCSGLRRAGARARCRP